MKKFALGLSLLVSMGLGTIGCGDSGDGGCPDGQIPCDGVCIDAIQPTLTSIQTGVFEVSCTASACHDDNLPAEMLDLSSVTASEESLVGVDSVQVDGKRVAASDSANSYLMNKLLGVDMALGTTRMPQLDLDGLCTPKIEVIRQWIDAGAPIN